jgi:hypothetical protein
MKYFGDKIKVEMGGICSTHGEMRNLNKILVVRNRPLERHMRRWDDNSKIG